MESRVDRCRVNDTGKRPYASENCEHGTKSADHVLPLLVKTQIGLGLTGIRAGRPSSPVDPPPSLLGMLTAPHVLRLSLVRPAAR